MALCQYFGKCGGCSAQHIPYELQLSNKREVLINELKTNNLSCLNEISVFHAEPYGYRNRMDFVFGQHGPGLRQKEKFNVIIPIEQCIIANRKIGIILSEVRQWFSANKAELDIFNLQKMAGTLKYAVIRAAEHTDSSAVSFVLNENSTKLGQHIELIKNLTTTAKNIVVARVESKSDISTSLDCFAVKGDVFMEELLCSKHFLFSSQGFFQNNTLMAEEMIKYCERVLKQHDTNTSLIDLYGGAGTFGVSLGNLFSRTTIIDAESPNIASAKKNLVENNVHGEALAGDASMLSKIKMPERWFLITDPPRTGMHQKVIGTILSLHPTVILYVSCNPKQLAKELRHFTGYTISSLAVFDLFPQTPHIEVIAELIAQ